jgi:hypothetical protein
MALCRPMSLSSAEARRSQQQAVHWFHRESGVRGPECNPGSGRPGPGTGQVQIR